jgi:integrase
MAVYDRRDSRFWWMHLEKADLRLSTGIPKGSKHARTQSRQDADSIYRAAMGDVARGTFKIPTKKSPRTFREQAIWYRDHVALHHRGGRREVSIIKALIEAFGDERLSAIDAHRIHEWKTARAETHAKSSVNRELDVLKPLLRSAVPKYLERNPADDVSRFAVRQPPIAILSESAEDALLEHASPAERAMVLLGLDALLRLGDVRRLKAEHDRGDHLVITDPKTEPYKVPISARLRAALDVLTPQGGFYFPRRYAGKWAAMGEGTAFAMFRALCDRANVPAGRKICGITFHSLRHTGATRATRHVKLTVVQRLGGWKSLKQLTRYDHPDDAEIIRAVEAIGSRVAHAPERKRKKAQ